MARRMLVRQKCVDHHKSLRAIKSYEKLVKFENEMTEGVQLGISVELIGKRIEEIKSENTKTIAAMNHWKPVRIPEIKPGEDGNTTDSVSAKALEDERLLLPLKKKQFIKPSHFIRYQRKNEKEEDCRYVYEATQKDLHFLSGMKGSPFGISEFEELINTFEKLNSTINEKITPEQEVKMKEMRNDVMHLDYFFQMEGRQSNKHPKKDIEKVYEYWKTLRESIGNVSLVRKYREKPDPHDLNHKVIFRPLKEEKKKLRKPRTYDMTHLVRMEKLRANLIEAKKLIVLAKKREKIKKGKIALDMLNFELQGRDLRDCPSVFAQYNAFLKEVESITGKEIIFSPLPLPPPHPLPNARPNLITDPGPTISSFEGISYENQAIVCDFEFACIISSVAAQVLNPKKEVKLKLQKQRIMARHGTCFMKKTPRLEEITGKVIDNDFLLTYTPNFTSLPHSGKRLLTQKASNNEAQDFTFIPLQEKSFSEICLPGIDHDSLIDLDTRYKHLRIGLENFLKNKK